VVLFKRISKVEAKSIQSRR